MDIEIAIEKSLSLISPIGQYHYRGKKYKEYLNPEGKWHYDEAGDATFHTAILCNSLTWAYKNTDNKNKRKLYRDNIEKMLSYFILGQNNRDGCLIRDIVDSDAYVRFPKSEQNSDSYVKIGGGIVDKGPSMKYTHVGISGHLYMMRYDISLDSISQVITALYWIRKFIPELTELVKSIAKKQLSYYEKNDWKIKDIQGHIVRYGDHTPCLLIPMGELVKLLLNEILDNSLKKNLNHKIINMFLRTYISGIYKSKRDRKQYNNYMFTNILFSLIDSGYDFNRAIKRLIKETEGESNYFSNAVSNYLYNTEYPTIQQDSNYKLREMSYDSAPYKSYLPISPWLRYGWNAWECSPYLYSHPRMLPPDQALGQADIIQAWYLY